MATTNLLRLLQELRTLIDEAIGELQESPSSKSRPVPHRVMRQHVSHIAFDLNALAFMNKYARGLSGAQKFTLLISWLSKGSSKAEISIQDAVKQWNRMRTVVGGEFNRVSANRAKAEGWVDSPKRGIYVLSESWQECLTEK